MSKGLPRDALQQAAQWEAEQVRMAAQADVTDDALGFGVPVGLAPGWDGAAADGAQGSRPDLPPLKYVGGIDISFGPGADNAVASLVVCAYPSGEVLFTAMRRVAMEVPYVPGFLAYREVPAALALLTAVRAVCSASPGGEGVLRQTDDANMVFVEGQPVMPQVLLVDGSGIFHPRRCGSATALGILADIPCVGVAKNFLAVEGLDGVRVQQLLQGAAREASGVHLRSRSTAPPVAVPLKTNDGCLLGFAALTGNSTRRPVFISPGHRVSCATALKLALELSHHRVPEPIRQADLRSRAFIRQHGGPSAADGR